MALQLGGILAQLDARSATTQIAFSDQPLQSMQIETSGALDLPLVGRDVQTLLRAD